MKCSVTIDGAKINDWESFHDAFQKEMGFFLEYGRNMDAWIDCMSDMYTNGEYRSLTKFNLNDGDQFFLRLVNTKSFQDASPDVFSAFITCLSAVNTREAFTQIYLELL